MTHLHWSSETEPNVCPVCGGKTFLLIASPVWDADEETSPKEMLYDGVSVNVEVSGHWCRKCDKIRSVAVNVGDG